MSIETALELIESVKDYRVMFVGDTIIDEYHYVSSLGKSPKENLIPVRYLEEEKFQGGVEAAANHARSFCRYVSVRTDLCGVRKVRMVERDYMRKLFEVHYNGNVRPLEPQDASSFDCVVVTGFGHGCINQESVGWLTACPYLAVNAQTNSANIGFNLITKYPRADYIVIDEPEARLAAADRDGPIESVIEKLAQGRCGKFVVTHGKYGAYGYDNGKFYHHNSYTDLVRDTMGAGDAFFAVTAPMSKTGSMEDLLLIGNAAGALKTQIIGHRKSVTKDDLIAFIRAH